MADPRVLDAALRLGSLQVLDEEPLPSEYRWGWDITKGSAHSFNTLNNQGVTHIWPERPELAEVNVETWHLHRAVCGQESRMSYPHRSDMRWDTTLPQQRTPCRVCLTELGSIYEERDK